MIKEIKYTGFTATPSDYESLDGELDAAINLVPEDGELKPVQGGKAIDRLGEGEEVLLIHVVNSGKKHLIIKNGYDLGYRELGSSDAVTPIKTFDTDNFKCSATGNVLCVYGIGEMEHFLFKNGAYIQYDSTQYSANILFGVDCQSVSKSTERVDKLFLEQQGGTASTWENILNTEFSRDGRHTVTIEATLEANKTYRIKFSDYHYSSTYYWWYVSLELYEHTNQSDGLWTFYHDPRFYINDAFVFTTTHAVSTIKFNFYNTAEGAGGTYNNGVLVGIISGTLTGDFLIDKQIKDTGQQTNYIISDIVAAQDAVLGCANALVAEQTEANKFTLPFFVRYGFRLLNNSIVTVSPPILIEPNDGVAPIIIASDIEGAGSSTTGNYYSAVLTSKMFSGRLKYRVRDIEKLRVLIENDYIMSLVVAVSDPIFRYKQDATEEEIRTQSYTTSGVPTNKCYAIGGVSTTEGGDNQSVYITLPTYQSSYEDLLKNVGTFKIIKEISKNDIVLNGEFVNVDLDAGTLSGLEGNTSEMPDNTENLSTYDSKYVMSYNLREHMIDVYENLYCGFDLDTMCGYVGGTAHDTNYKVAILFDEREGYQYLVRGKREESSINRRWFFYPNKYAEEVTVYEGEQEVQKRLVKHPKLKGAYNFDDTNGSRSGYSDGGNGFYDDDDEPGTSDTSTDSGIDTPTQYVSESKRNYIYVSEQGNPIVIDQRLRVGDGVLYAAAANTKPISRGQMGVAPLFVFASDGIWALELITRESSTTETTNVGEYAAKQTVTRDVLTNVDSITPIDSAVLFSTKRGIMILGDADRGSVCVTDMIFSDADFNLIGTGGTLPKLERLTESFPIVGIAAGIVPFKAFLPGARMLYDYVHQRIIVYSHEQHYAYIYSLKSKAWGMMSSKITYGINSYPECLAVDEDGNIINLSAVDADATDTVAGSQMLVTRALKLDDGDVLKTIDTIIQRGRFKKESVKGVILYGSRDLFNWHLVYSSKDHYLRGFRGTPYKYFRIVVLGELQKDESLFGCTIQHTPRLLDQIR